MSFKESDISVALQARAGMVCRLRGLETPEDRLARFGRLQAASFELLRSSPEGWRHFIQRNLHSRRVKVIDGKWRPVSADRCAGEA